MCIWKVAPEDRLCKYCSYVKGCEVRLIYGKKVGVSEHLDEYVSAMNDIVGGNIIRRSRDKRLVWGRYLVSYKLSLDGFSNMSIGRMLGLDRCSIIHALAMVGEMMNSPMMYLKEMEIWDNFNKKIEYESMEHDS